MTLIDFNSDEHNQRLRHYPFLISLGRFSRSCNTFDNPSSGICLLNKTCKFDVCKFHVTVDVYLLVENAIAKEKLNNNKY